MRAYPVNTLFKTLTINLPYILESNPHPFYSFRGLKNQMRIRIACGLDSQSWDGFWKSDRAAVRAVRTIQYNNLLFYLLFIIHYIIFIMYYSSELPTLLITIAILHPVTIISCGAFVPLAVKLPLHTRCVSRITVKALVTSNIIQSVCLVGKWRLKERCGSEPRTNIFSLRNRQKLVRIRFGCGLHSRIYGTYLHSTSGLLPLGFYIDGCT